MRKTKIICTIGPSCSDENTIREMMLAGMNVARLNFSHGTHEDHLEKIRLIKRLREELDLPVAIMLDTKGPEYRIRKFKNDKVFLNPGDSFTFTTEDVEGDENRVSVSYKGLADDLEVGDTILLNNGLLRNPYRRSGRRRAVQQQVDGFPGKGAQAGFLKRAG